MSLYCTNCGKKNHVYRDCKEPITSYGIILIKLFDDTMINDIQIGENKIVIDSETSIRAADHKDILLFSKINNSLKFLMIRRKHTLGYIEFIRGRYRPENPDGIIFLFQQMTQSEIDDIGKFEFDVLWNKFWGDSDKKKLLDFEFNKSKEKFDSLKNGYTDINLSFFVDNVKPCWDEPEWGFPKGRKNKFENNYECARREFEEESGLCADDYNVFENIEPFVEDFIGTNGLRYRHVYYVAISKSDKIPEISNSPTQAGEIGAIEYYTYYDCLKIIRPHHIARKSIVTDLYNYITNNIIVNKNK